MKNCNAKKIDNALKQLKKTVRRINKDLFHQARLEVLFDRATRLETLLRSAGFESEVERIADGMFGYDE